MLKKLLYKHSEIDLLNEKIFESEAKDSSFAKRTLTGLAAENYFKENYRKIISFEAFELEDVSNYGCGFDFKLHSNFSEFLAIEVKGMNDSNGNIVLTNKEHKVAQILGDRYFLFVVKNFSETPTHEHFQNPLYCNKLNFEEKKALITQVSYQTKI